MAKITEAEFRKLCGGIYDDRLTIWKHNPIGTKEEILLWMLLSVLIIYLNLSEAETPSFTGTPNAETYRAVILAILKKKKAGEFSGEHYLRDLCRGL